MSPLRRVFPAFLALFLAGAESSLLSPPASNHWLTANRSTVECDKAIDLAMASTRAMNSAENLTGVGVRLPSLTPKT